MEIIILIILSVFMIIFCARYIVINEKSLIGIICLKCIKLITSMTRNHNRLLLEQYKKLNKLNEWKIKEGNFKNYSIRKLDIDGLEASMLTPNNNTSGKIILQLHGGGYEIDLPNNSLYFAKKYFKYTKTFEILTINYRVAPENKYPAALEDTIKAYNWMLENGYTPQNIIFAGDSAGGGLALSSIMYFKDNNMPLPKAVITMSAWTNLANTGKSFKDNFLVDPMFGNINDSILNISTYAENSDKKDPYISPYFGNYSNFPDMLMQVGEKEMLLSDTIDVADMARQAGINVIQTTYKGMFHVFQKYNNLIPEAIDAWQEISWFIESMYK